MIRKNVFFRCKPKTNSESKKTSDTVCGTGTGLQGELRGRGQSGRLRERGAPFLNAVSVGFTPWMIGSSTTIAFQFSFVSSSLTNSSTRTSSRTPTLERIVLKCYSRYQKSADTSHTLFSTYLKTSFSKRGAAKNKSWKKITPMKQTILVFSRESWLLCPLTSGFWIGKTQFRNILCDFSGKLQKFLFI